MIESIEFQKTAVQQSADRYQEVKLPGEYKQLMQDISKVIAPYIVMNDGAVRGFILRAIKTWQTRNDMEIAQVLSMSLEQRKKMMKEGMDILKDILGGILKTPSDRGRLDEAIEKGYNDYLNKFILKKE